MISTGIVGPIVGPIGTRREGQLGTLAWVNTDVPYTFALGGIPFIIAPGDEHPYQRTTAQFRKQQFDSAAAVGEQSLDGFWRRSQLSFHKGAGIRYLDAVETDGVVNRAFDIDGLDPWTPGEVTVGSDWETTFTDDHSLVLVGYDGSSTQQFWYRGSDGHIYKRTTGSATDVSGATAAAFAVDPNPSGRGYYTATTTVKTSNGGATIATHSTLNWSGLWWAKGRLIGMDAEGRFYSLVPNPSSPPTVATSDAFWSGTSQTSDWAIADSPGAIYLARGGTIYVATLDAQGEVPELTAPATAAELPQGELIRAMAYYLGFLVIVTNQGVRIGLTESSQVQYGPQLFEWESSVCKTIAAKGSIVYVTGKREDDDTERVFAINLGEQTAEGAFAWAVEHSVPSYGDTPSASGCLVRNNFVTAWDGSNIWQATGIVANVSGVLETGFIRFGTMEPKAFHSLKVKLDGTGGNVTVALVRRGGSDYTLASIAAAPNVEAEIPLNILRPEEFIGFKFILTAPDGSHVPKLLGYQLKALPAPTRQRILEVPVLCYDKEVARNGEVVGYEGRAWEILQAVEQMEAQAGEVLSQDFRTKEQSVVFIEQVQFINRTAPKSYVSGHGGLLILTLRQV